MSSQVGTLIDKFKSFLNENRAMKENVKRILVIQAGIIFAPLLVFGAYFPSFAASKAPQTFPASAIKALSAKWWQWAFSFNSDQSPLSDATGERCDKGDVGKVFYLAGTAGLSSGTAERNCTVSSKQAILFPVANASMSHWTPVSLTKSDGYQTTATGSISLH